MDIVGITESPDTHLTKTASDMRVHGHQFLVQTLVGYPVFHCCSSNKILNTSYSLQSGHVLLSELLELTRAFFWHARMTCAVLCADRRCIAYVVYVHMYVRTHVHIHAYARYMANTCTLRMRTRKCNVRCSIQFYMYSITAF